MRHELRTETWRRSIGENWKSGDPTEEVTGPREYHIVVDHMAEAQGVSFLCPLCRDHHILCWFKERGVPDDAVPGPGRWIARGTDANNITFDNDGNRSVLLTPPSCGAHFHVTDGEVTNA